MAIFNYNRDIPDGPNNPSNDQPLMKTNTNSTDEILAVDHVSFEAQNGGTHKQVSFFSNNVPGALGANTSVIYTNAGSADATHPQLYWKNTLLTSPLSAIRSFATFTSATGAIVPDNAFNIASINKASASSAIDITLTANAILNTTPPVVFITYSTGSGSGVLNYTIAGDVITTEGIGNGRKINVLVLQV